MEGTESAKAKELEGEENHVNVEEIVVFSIGGDGLGSVEAPCSSNNYLAFFSVGGDGLGNVHCRNTV